jgi:hypothetical protein
MILVNTQSPGTQPNLLTFRHVCVCSLGLCLVTNSREVVDFRTGSYRTCHKAAWLKLYLQGQTKTAVINPLGGAILLVERERTA